MKKDQKPGSEELADLPHKPLDEEAGEAIRGGAPTGVPIAPPGFKPLPNPRTIIPCV
jgi:hypothetical protein